MSCATGYRFFSSCLALGICPRVTQLKTVKSALCMPITDQGHSVKHAATREIKEADGYPAR